MTDKTFTDEEIVKVLEMESVPSEMNCVYVEYIEACGIYCTKKKQNAKYCHDCKEYKMDYRGRRSKATLDLINRQKAEIEKLIIDRNAARLGMIAEHERAKTLRSQIALETIEAIERLAMQKKDSDLCIAKLDDSYYISAMDELKEKCSSKQRTTIYGTKNKKSKKIS